MESELLVVIAVIFALSLLGAFVLFKFLKSTAIIKRSGYQAGGALAGFLLVFAALYGAYAKLADAERAETWTIEGKVNLEGDTMASEDVSVAVIPPMRDFTREGGGFRIEDVSLPEGGWPEMKFAVKGYETLFLQVKDDLIEVDRDTRKITFKQPVTLTKLTGRKPPQNMAAFGGTVLSYIRKRTPLGDARVELRDPATGQVRYHVYSDAKGEFSFGEIEPGRYEIGFWINGPFKLIAPESTRIHLKPGEEDTQKVYTVRGRS